MRESPKVRSDSFWGDLTNTLLLKPVYRQPQPAVTRALAQPAQEPNMTNEAKDSRLGKSTSDNIDQEAGDPKYVITYYGTGMTPKHKYLNDLREAISEFEKMAADPYAGARSLELRQTLMKVK